MDPTLDLFEKILYEAPDDDPPDAGMANTGPPDMPDGAAGEAGPPDMGGDMGDDGPPDMGGYDSDEPPGMDDDTFGMDDTEGEDDQNQNQEQEIEGLDEKVSAIMNQQLYQRFLAMLNTIGNQITQVKSNNDILYTLAPDCLDIVDSLTKLDENIRLHLKNSFLDDNYSKNLLFFNKCLNLLKLLNDVFSEKIRKGIKDAE